MEQESEGGAGDGGKGKGASEEALVRVLRELATVQRNLANLQVELQGRQVQSFLPSFCFSVFSCGPGFDMAIHCITSTHLALKISFSWFIELSDEKHGGDNVGKYWLLRLLGVKDDERVAHLTHVSEIKKKSEALAKTTATLQDVIHNKV